MNFHKPWGAFLEDPEKCSYSKSRSNISNLMIAVLFYLLNMTRSTLHTRRISRRIHLSVTPFGVTKNSFARPKRFHSEAFDRQILRVRVWQKKKINVGIKNEKAVFFPGFIALWKHEWKLRRRKNVVGTRNASFWLMGQRTMSDLRIIITTK